jgi:hypothetical protein
MLKYMGAVVFAGAVLLAPTTHADPNNGGGTGGEWDIGAYDFCMSHHPPWYTTEDVLDGKRQCCESSGGVWGSGVNGCHAPAAATIGPGHPPQQVTPPNKAPAAPPSPPPSKAPSKAPTAPAG